MNEQAEKQDSGWVGTFVFIAGFILGAGAATFLAQEPGSRLRERLAKGAKTAQEELTETATETKESLAAISQEFQKTLKQAVSRLSTAVEATKEAVTADLPPSQESSEELTEKKF